MKMLKELILELISIAAIIICFFYLIKEYTILPAVIPSTFTFNGEAASFSSKDMLLIAPIAQLLLYIIFSALQKLPTYRILIAKLRGLQNEHARSIHHFYVQIFKIEISWALTFMELNSLNIAQRENSPYNMFTLLLMICIIITITIYSHRMSQKNNDYKGVKI